MLPLENALAVPLPKPANEPALLLACPICGAANEDSLFCTSCGARLLKDLIPAAPPAIEPPLAAPSSPLAVPSVGSPAPVSALPLPESRVSPVVAVPFPSGATPSGLLQVESSVPSASARRYLPLVIAVALVAFAGLSVLIYLNWFSAKRSILAEVKKGNLVKPEGSSAYDLYLKHIRDGLSTEDRTEIERETAPALEKRGTEILTKLKQEASESEVEWAEAARLYGWLHELRPQAAYESRKYFAQARLAFLKGETNKAIADYRRAIDLDSSWALPFNGLARAFVKMRDRASAKDYYLRATAIEPNWIYPWINLSGLSLDLKDYATAGDAARRALAIDPNKASAHYFLARALEELERGCEAVSQYQLALQRAYDSADPGFSIDVVRNKIDRLKMKYNCAN